MLKETTTPGETSTVAAKRLNALKRDNVSPGEVVNIIQNLRDEQYVPYVNLPENELDPVVIDQKYNEHFQKEQRFRGMGSDQAHCVTSNRKMEY